MRQTRSGAPRGLCGMGVCFDCLVTVDGGEPSAPVSQDLAGMEGRSTPGCRHPVAAARGCRGDRLRRACGRRRPRGPVGGARAHVRVPRSSWPTSACSPAANISSRWRLNGRRCPPPSIVSSATAVTAARLEPAFESSARRRCGPRSRRPKVAAIVAGRSTLFRPKRLVLATGAYEQSLPVPGWTRGVMTVMGGLRTLARVRIAARLTHRHRRQRPLVPADGGRG